LLCNHLPRPTISAGFLAYDPQTGRALGPDKEEFAEHLEYDRIAENLPEIIAQGVTIEEKPWRKFW